MPQLGRLRHRPLLTYFSNNPQHDNAINTILFKTIAAMVCLGSFSSVFSPVLAPARTGTLTVQLRYGENVTSVGAIRRWEADGNAVRPVDPKAKIDAPAVSASGKQTSAGQWIFENLPPGNYDLVILAKPRIRIEGFRFPPVLEFDPFLDNSAKITETAREQVAREIAQSRHYENKVTPLYYAGDQRQVRVLVQLLRDRPTSYDRQYGEPVATLRHEVWQYTNHYGGWAKEKRTRVFDRIIMPKEELRRWTWIWHPKLGGIEIENIPVTLLFELPRQYDPQRVRGLLPE